MSVSHNDTQQYAASCNPSRRAKRLRSESTSNPIQSLSSEHHPQHLPVSPGRSSSSYPKLHPRTSAHDSSNNKSSPSVMSQAVSAAASRSSWHNATANTATTSSSSMTIPTNDGPNQKRARKATSRAAREAQRKLNHSMIEKVRRTKINEALATLKSLVPIDYAHGRTAAGSDEDDDNEDIGEDETRADSGRKRPSKGPSKKDENQKEYKLEILVRTVVYLQDLIEKVKVLETDRANDLCANCGENMSTSIATSQSSGKRKRTHSRERADDDGEENGGRGSKASPEIARLPSISSWLPSTIGNPGIQLYGTPSSRYAFHLPSPPSSTLVDPVKTTLHPPALTLDLPLAYKSSPSNAFGPSQRSSLATTSPTHTGDPYVPVSPQRTPDDESAASMLLQISNSPPCPPHYSASIRSPSSPFFELPKVASSLVPGTGTGSGSNLRTRPPPGLTNTHSPLQAQTPSSLLGLDCSAHREHL